MTEEIFCRILRDACDIAHGAHILAAVSGGADSVAMLCLLAAARETMDIRVSAAHVEHGIRGEESVADMEFVRELCRQKNVPFYAKRVNAPAYAKEKGCGLEAAARELRYAFLEEIQKSVGADVIAVAHHSGDQAETVLMRAARGSDLRGLCAMRMRNGGVIRPLLHASCEELRKYLREIRQDWREDATNSDTDYTRNAIRHRVLPELERAYPGAKGALSRLAHSAQRDEDYFSQQIAALSLHLTPLTDGMAVKKETLIHLHEALLSRVIARAIEAAGAQASGYVIDRIVRAVQKDETTAAIGIGAADGQTVRARFGEEFLCITRPYMDIADTPLAMEGKTQTPFGVFCVRRAQAGETGDGITSQSVPTRLLESAVVGVRREGDAMIPFGQHTPVKLKKLMIDRGVERAMRRSIPVIRSKEGILWASGIRPSQLCLAREDEERMMITFHALECVKI